MKFYQDKNYVFAVNVSEHAVKQAGKLMKEKWILATPSNYYREGFDKETKNVLLNSMREMIAVVCLQVKEIVWFKNKDDSKEVQKRLLLANISEIYANFKAEFPILKIGFSTFALLQPEWCMSVGVDGLHNL